jgi:NADPH:quinone reductase-like Zn-dependent oxidoreductase
VTMTRPTWATRGADPDTRRDPQRQGADDLTPWVKPDVIALADGTGEIMAIGDAVTRAKVGDRVACTVFPKGIDGRFSWEVAAGIGRLADGTLTEFVVADQDAIVHVPEHLLCRRRRRCPAPA